MKSAAKLKNQAALVRAIAILSGVAVLVTGVTFAALQSQQATLTGNSIQSATADLRIGTSQSTFDASRNGFSFKDLVPGGPAVPADGHTFYLKDYGSASLKLRLALGSVPANTANMDLSKVKLVLNRVDTASADQTISLKALSETGLQLTDPINAGTVAQYKLRAVMEADAYEGTGAAVTGIDLVFSGTAL